MPQPGLQVPGQTQYGMPDLTKFGVPSISQFLPKPKEETRHQDVKMIYRDLLSKGLTPKDAAKQAQAMTGHSAVTGQLIRRTPKFSRKVEHKVVGQYGTSGKINSRRYGQYDSFKIGKV